MKKLLALLLLSTTAFALPIGNPIDASLYSEGVFCDSPLYGIASLRLGFYGDYVFDRHLKIDDETNHNDMSKTELNTNAGFIVLNFCDRIDAFATVGASNISVHGRANSFGATADNSYFVVASETAFSWSVGARGTVFCCGNWGFGLEWQYFRTTPNLRSLSDYRQTVSYDSNVEMQYREWQVGFGPSYTVEIVPCSLFVIPYAGVKWANAKLDMDDHRFVDSSDLLIARLFNLENARNWGWAFGLTMLGGCKWTLTGEVRFVDELAAHVNTQFRF